MKLVSPDNKSQLPESLEERPAWWKRALKKVGRVIWSSNGITISIAVLMFVITSSILCITYLDSSKYIDENGISVDTFFAERRIEIEDTEETERKVERARQNVPLIYKNADPINASIRDTVKKTVDQLSTITSAEAIPTKDPTNPHPLTIEEKRATFQELLGDDPEVVTLYERLSKKELKPEYWDKIGLIADASAKTILKNGLTLDDYLQRDNIIRKALPKYGTNQNDARLVFYIIDQSLQPNRIVDEEAMTFARDKAEHNVQPVMKIFKKSQKIVERGEELSNLQIAALQKMGKSVQDSNWVACMGVVLLTLLFTISLFGYTYTYEDHKYFKPSYSAMLATLIVITVGLFEIFASYSSVGTLPIYAFPLATMSFIVAIFTHHRFGILVTILTVFLFGLTLKIDFTSLSVLLFGAISGIYILSRRMNFKNRGQLMYAGLYVSLTNALIIISMHLLNSASFINNPWNDLVTSVGWGFLSGFLSGILTIGLLPFLESIFRLVTPFSLMELADTEHPLLKRMQFEAPGTYHHSLVVASLAEAASEAINANPLLTRVGCLYHDIGKMKRPLFFIENLQSFGVNENPHDKLTPRLSKMVITAHPRDSLEMARQHKLPHVVKKFMTEHHGTMTAGYFYNKACQEEGAENVNKSQFRYPGPKPNIKETAIAMLADACESAVRALDNPTVQQIEERIDNIIKLRIEDGQFTECPLTFKDLETVKQTFLRILRGIHHTRIEYHQNIFRDLGRRVQKSTVDENKLQDLMSDLEKPDNSSTALEKTNEDNAKDKSDASTDKPKSKSTKGKATGND